MSTESKYNPGDIVKLKPNKSNESKKFDYAVLKAKMLAWRQSRDIAWETYNEDASGIWEEDIERLATEEEYEKYQLQQALK